MSTRTDIQEPGSNIPCDTPLDAPETRVNEFLTCEQDAFALALVEYNGNLKAAYSAVFGTFAPNPLANARILSTNPLVAARVRELLFAAEEQDLISRSAHLAELAEIRDMAKIMGAPKVALEAERSRGEVAGFYKSKAEVSGPNGGPVQLQLQGVEWSVKG